MHCKKLPTLIKLATSCYLICLAGLLLYSHYYGNGQTFKASDRNDEATGERQSSLLNVKAVDSNSSLNIHSSANNTVNRIQSINCPNVTIPTVADVGTRWWNVTNERKYYVYSAYIDGDKVRIIGAASNDGNGDLHCQLWFKDKDGSISMATRPATIKKIPENRGLKYSATYYLCQILDPRLPYAVSLVQHDACQTPRHLIHIHTNTGKKEKYSICVKPFVYNYARAYELVEWLELHIMLGVGHFTFFNHSSRPNIKTVLDHYSKRGLVEVLEWNLPMKISTWPPSKAIELHAFGHLVSSNDCLYRHVGRSEYLSIVDVDEFITPKHKDDVTWDDMFRRLPVASEYTFRNCFFRKEWNDSSVDTNATANELMKKYKLVTVSKLQREDKIWAKGQRSKLIVKPADIETMGIHNAWSRKGGSAHTVNPDIGMLHHYRDWESIDDKKRRVPDDTMLKFKDTIITRVHNTWKELPGVEIDIPKDSR